MPSVEPARFEVDLQRVPLGVIRIRGELDLSQVPELAAAVHAAYADSPGEIVIDCAALTYLDSSGIYLIAEARGRLAAEGRPLVLRNVNGAPRRALELCDLTAWIEA